ncbi:hypothetical protein FGO68_gene17410 [Halteria grandinella]|uniref:Uncharacterized protein n=1 Tax=Halteria grandinella TaxID=5974 RepID=A0A8J8NVH5_HALGN|nr:hypothetical protein FGO68_gene17410 [Halteria grandinella]
MHEFQEIHILELLPQNPKIKLRESTKKVNPSSFKAVKSEEEVKVEEERRKEARTATAEEVAEEIKVPVVDRVTPYWKYTYEEQIEKKRAQLTDYLTSFSTTLEADLKSHKEDQLPSWYTPSQRDKRLPCELSHIIECPSAYRDSYRNKVEFTIGRRYQDNAICIGFNAGNLSKGITFVDYPDGIKTNSQESVIVAKAVEKLVIESGLEPYDKRINQGFWRLLLFRESKRTNQLLISVIVTDKYPHATEEKIKEIEDKLKDLFKEGTLINTLQVVSLSMIYATELSGGYKETDRINVLSGRDYYEEELCGYKFRVSPFAFFQVNTSVFTEMLSIIAEFAQIDENTVLFDVCCGTGAIGICLSKTAKKVIGIELIESAVENAKINLKLNGLDEQKCEFHAGRAEELLPNIVREYSTKGLKIVAIVDPPRSGLHKDVLKALRTCKGLDRLVYVSCNPQSQMKDMQALCYAEEKKRRAPAFKPIRAIGADLFPHTNHIESIVMFERFYE